MRDLMREEGWFVTRSETGFDLDSAAAALLDRDAPASASEAACASVHAQCLARLPALGDSATALAIGHAIAPVDAARCVLDHVRTACLLRALDARIAERVARGGQVRVLYAGCGPLAPLALLLARRWRGREVKFDLIDIHEQSIAAAERLFGLAGVSETLGSLRCADAATLRLDDDEMRPDILVAEVMQRALAREPQVAVVANLLPQCAPDASLVPGRITVDALCGPPATTACARLRLLGRLFTVDPETVPAMAAAIRGGASTLPEVVLQVPADLEDGQGMLLATRIEAGPGETLEAEDSGLTAPLFLAQLGRLAPGETLGFAYRLGREPGFDVRRLETAPR